MAATLKRYPHLTIEAAGYTDNTGAAHHDERLSKQRAITVRNYLIGKGVNPENLEAKGYGTKAPIASNDTDAGRAINRRVELSIIEE